MKAFLVLYAYILVVAVSLSWLFGTIIQFMKGA